MVGHASYDVRLVFKADALVRQLLISSIDVRNVKVKNRAGMIELWFFRWGEHQAHAATIKETQVAGAEQQWQAERVPVKSGGALRVMHVDGNLSQPRNSGSYGCGAHKAL